VTGVQNSAWTDPLAELIDQWRKEAVAHMPAPEEWADFIVSLKCAVELDRLGSKAEDLNLPEGMTAAQKSVYAILCLLKPRALVHDAYLSPLAKLHDAIVDLENGRVSDLFKPRKRRPGNPGKGVGYEVIQGLAARALTELIDGGDDPKLSAGRIATVLRGIRKAMKNVTGETVTNWRERIMQGPGPGAPGWTIAHYNAALPENFGHTPKERGETLLLALKKNGATIG
jgi:hypothetical protein